MASPTTVDFDALLAPISEEAPTGIALKDDPAASSVYYAVKDAREAARAAERAGANAAWDEEGAERAGANRPDWSLVVRLATDALREKTKDLWIATWLLEGLTRQHGFAGVRDGFHLIRKLCERYFDQIHPRPDDDGVATTVAQLAGLNGEGAEGALLAPLAAIPITQGTSVGPFTGRDYADAENIARTADPEVRSKRIAQGAATLEMFEAAARETSPDFFANLREDIAAAIEEFDKMNAVLADRCGLDGNGYSAAPPSSKISATLADALARVRTLAGDAPEAAGVESPANGGSTGGGGDLTAIVSNISSREDAFKALMRVADFFRRTEPHSPVSYALEQAVRWGRMPLPELIRDLVSDEGVRREFFRRTGMTMEKDND